MSIFYTERNFQANFTINRKKNYTLQLLIFLSYPWHFATLNQGSCRALERVCSLDIHNLRRRRGWSFDRSRRLRQKKCCFSNFLATVSLVIFNLYLKRHFSGTLYKQWWEQFDQFYNHWNAKGSYPGQEPLRNSLFGLSYLLYVTLIGGW